MDVLHTYGADYQVVIVGDAAMSPYEVTILAVASNISMMKPAACGSNA
ncbi:hypothetical protein HAALTHF_41880n [Vreelandella aquamarina]|nr:hypothetical protein HAALTHF_41880n [Halomonas axialensis]